MLNFAKACCLCVAMALILALSGAPTHAGLSTNCVAADRSDTSLLLQVKKQKKHKDGQSQNDSGLTECTVVQPGGGGGCKGGFKWVCEKMKSGNKCCGCVANKGSQAAGDDEPKTGTQAQGSDAQDWVDTQNKAEGRFGVGFDAVPPSQTTPQQAPAGQGGENTDNVLWRDYQQTKPQQAPAQGGE
jgi:hypothetical protein